MVEYRMRRWIVGYRDKQCSPTTQTTFILNVGISGNILWITLSPTKHYYESE